MIRNNDEDFEGFEVSPQAQQDNQLCLTKISNFLEMKNISIGEFWQSDRNYASPQDI